MTSASVTATVSQTPASLQTAPDAREPMLAEGTWLVLGFAVWSVPDRQAIDVALSAAQAFRGNLLLGVRPFDDHAEFETWSEAQERAGSPVWLLLRAGTLLSERMGQISVDDLVGWIARETELRPLALAEQS